MLRWRRQTIANIVMNHRPFAWLLAAFGFMVPHLFLLLLHHVCCSTNLQLGQIRPNNLPSQEIFLSYGFHMLILVLPSFVPHLIYGHFSFSSLSSLSTDLNKSHLQRTPGYFLPILYLFCDRFLAEERCGIFLLNTEATIAGFLRLCFTEPEDFMRS